MLLNTLIQRGFCLSGVYTCQVYQSNELPSMCQLCRCQQAVEIQKYTVCCTNILAAV